MLEQYPGVLALTEGRRWHLMSEPCSRPGNRSECNSVACQLQQAFEPSCRSCTAPMLAASASGGSKDPVVFFCCLIWNELQVQLRQDHPTTARYALDTSICHAQMVVLRACHIRAIFTFVICEKVL